MLWSEGWLCGMLTWMCGARERALLTWTPWACGCGMWCGRAVVAAVWYEVEEVVVAVEVVVVVVWGVAPKPPASSVARPRRVWAEGGAWWWLWWLWWLWAARECACWWGERREGGTQERVGRRRVRWGMRDMREGGARFSLSASPPHLLLLPRVAGGRG